MLDPFGDYATAGYLRNVMAEKDPSIIRHVQHDVFRANLPQAIDYLASVRKIAYAHFLQVHKILFGDFYPWAGQDRRTTAPNSAIRKAATLFCHPNDCQRAVEQALREAQEQKQIAERPGHVMGLLAYGHPFLDGNGRAMLVVHGELCYRSGMAIQWSRISKNDYLAALSKEIEHPGRGHLDNYLCGFIGPRVERDQWLQEVSGLKGLDGSAAEQAAVDGEFTDPQVAAKYSNFEQRRGYELTDAQDASEK